LKIAFSQQITLDSESIFDGIIRVLMNLMSGNPAIPSFLRDKCARSHT
jgi:hypothetical protein